MRYSYIFVFIEIQAYLLFLLRPDSAFEACLKFKKTRG